MTGKNKGITLIELLVGITCFSIIIILVTSIFVNAIGGKKQVKELSVLQDEARYIIDYMTREIRMAKIISDAGEGKKTLEIEKSEGRFNYNFSNNNIKRKGKVLNTVNVDGYFDIDKNGQPKVTIDMTLSKDDQELTIQTTISSRSYQ